MLHVICGGLDEPAFASRYAEPMFRQRCRVFHERLRWDVAVQDGLERDEFDDARTRYIVLADGAEVVGSWRLRPTTARYMLADVFAPLLAGQAAPRDPRIWEISRFAMEPERRQAAAAGAAVGAASAATSQPAPDTAFGLCGAARALLRATARYAVDHGITQYVMVASAAAERLYRHLGLRVHRFGPPQRFGRALSVAGWVDIDAHTRHVLLGAPRPMAEAA